MDTKSILSVLSIGVGAFALLQSLVSPVLPTLQHELGASQADATWIIIAYLLSAAVFLPIAGRAGDIWGKKKILIVCLLCLAFGAILSSFATSLPLMLVGRAIQGIGGGVLPIAFGIIRDKFPAHDVPRAVGVIASLSAVWAGIGVVAGGPVVEFLGYRWLFWGPALLLVLATIATFLLVPESPPLATASINILSATLMACWMVPLLVAATKINEWGWSSARVLILSSFSMTTAILWVFTESRSSNPLVDMHMMRIRAVWVVNLASFLFGAGMYGMFAYLPSFLQTPTETGFGFGLSPTQSGLMIFAQTVSMFMVGMVSGRLTNRFKSGTILSIGSLICAGSFTALAFLHDREWTVVIILLTIGVGFSLAFTSMSNIIVAAVPQNQTSVASGMNINLRNIGGALGSAVMALIVTAGVAPENYPSESGYIKGFLSLGCLLFLSAAVVIISSWLEKRSTSREENYPLIVHKNTTPTQIREPTGTYELQRNTEIRGDINS